VDKKQSLLAYKAKAELELLSRKSRLEQINKRISECLFVLRIPLAGRRILLGIDLLSIEEKKKELSSELETLSKQGKELAEDVIRAEERLEMVEEELSELLDDGNMEDTSAQEASTRELAKIKRGAHQE